jgi:molybdopterin-guanine dinucleotide biosynthesis protein A
VTVAERASADDADDVQILGAILAGGRSSRMGRDKAGVIVDGLTMREHVRRALAEVCDEVIVVGGDGADVDDPRQGPLLALLALLEARPGRTVLVAPVDQPRLTRAALVPLVAACGDDDGVCWADEPLPLCLGPRARPRLKTAIARGEGRVLSAITHQLPLVDDDVRAALVNVNTPADVAALARGS